MTPQTEILIRTTKLCQFIENNMRNIFSGTEKPYSKWGGKTSLRPFSKKSKLGKSLDKESECLQFAFNICPRWGLPKYIETKMVATCGYLI